MRSGARFVQSRLARLKCIGVEMISFVVMREEQCQAAPVTDHMRLLFGFLAADDVGDLHER